MPKPIHEQPGVFHLYIRTDNDAFSEDARLAVAALLRGVAFRLEDGDTFDRYRTIFDMNGNDVGRAKLNPAEGE